MKYNGKDRNDLIRICESLRREMLKMSGVITKQSIIISQLRSLEQEETVEEAGPGYPSYAGVCPACGVVTNLADSRYRCRNCGKRITWNHPVTTMVQPEIKDWQK